MKTQIPPATRHRLAFTLVELLVVMAVIATLAAMIFPAAAMIKRNAIIKRISTQMKLLEVALTAYQANLGHYPPDNPNAPEFNQLFFELAGTTNYSGNIYLSQVGPGITNIPAVYGTDVAGFVNVSRGSGDDVQQAKNYLNSLKSANYLEVQSGGPATTVLGVADKGPLMFLGFNDTSLSINPWRYASSSATNNPGKYDLWVDVIIGGKTNRFCNWSEKPLTVAY